MKKYLKHSNAIRNPFVFALTTLLCCFMAYGAVVKTGYVTKAYPVIFNSGTTAGTGVTVATTNTAEVFFPSEGSSTIRVTSVEALGDTNTTICTILGGTYPLTITGIINATNLTVASNTNTYTNCIAIIQGTGNDDTCFSVTVNMTNQATNIFIAATNSWAPILTNYIIWFCTNQVVFPVGSNNIVAVTRSGESLFAAQRRAPVAVRVTASGVNGNRVSATAKYDILP